MKAVDDKFTLKFNNVDLIDDHKLSQLGIKKGDTIQVVRQNVSGGGGGASASGPEWRQIIRNNGKKRKAVACEWSMPRFYRIKRQNHQDSWIIYLISNFKND